MSDFVLFISLLYLLCNYVPILYVLSVNSFAKHCWGGGVCKEISSFLLEMAGHDDKVLENHRIHCNNAMLE